MKKLRLYAVVICATLLSNVTRAFALSTISMDDEYSYAVTHDNILISHKFNSDEPCENLLNEVQGVSRNYALRSDGTLWTWGESLFGTFDKPTRVMNDVADIDAANGFAFIVKNDKTLWGIGENVLHSMGLLDYTLNTSVPVKIMNNVSKAAAGKTHGIVLKTDGCVITTGSNNFGALGIGTEEEIGVPRAFPGIEDVVDVYAGEYSSYAFKETDIWMWGTTFEWDVTFDIPSQFYPIKALKDAAQIVSNTGYDLVLQNDGTLWLKGVSGDKKEAYTQLDDGLIIFQMPYFVMDNVCRLNNGWNVNNRALILTADKQLYEFSLDRGLSNKLTVVLNKCHDKIKPLKAEEAPRTRNFIDIDDSDNAAAINKLSKAEILTGVSEGYFMPEKLMNRAEAASVLMKMLGKSAGTEPFCFSDVTPENWYYNYAAACKECGIASGFDDGSFKGGEPISALQLAAMESRTIQYEYDTASLNIRTDIETLKDIPEWAKKDIGFAIKCDLITQEEANNSANRYLSRGEAAEMLHRLYDLL